MDFDKQSRGLLAGAYSYFIDTFHCSLAADEDLNQFENLSASFYSPASDGGHAV